MGKKKISNDEILQVALQLIDENGIDNLQMKDIAARPVFRVSHHNFLEVAF